MNTEEDAIKKVKTKTGSSESAYFWHKPTKRLIEKPPSSKVGSGGKWAKGDGILFMYADDFADEFKEGTKNPGKSSSTKLFGVTLAILAGVSMIVSF